MEFRITGNIIYENNTYYCEYLNCCMKSMIRQLDMEMVGEADLVAVIMKRSPLLLTSMFALLNKRITFIPVDNNLPARRIEQIINQTHVTYIISDIPDLEITNEAVKIIHPSESQIMVDLDQHFENNDVAYVLSTSGTTGNPKAVAVRREGLESLASEIIKAIPIKNCKRILGVTTVSFDISFVETILSLHWGMDVILASDIEVGNPEMLLQLIEKYNIDLLQITPSRISLLILLKDAYNRLNSVRILMFGGEAVPDELLRRLQGNISADLYDCYGPTETTIYSTISNLTNKTSVDIGQALGNEQIFILDENLQCVKDGEVGEICIAGKGVAKGYLYNEELTKRRFITDKTLSDSPMYRTSDLGKIDENGNIICLGRIDTQVKIDGYRVELQEIEEAIYKLCDAQKVLVGYDSESKKLIGFVMSECMIDENRIVSDLRNVLPYYMIPVHIVKIINFEMSSNGKLNINKMMSDYCQKEEQESIVSQSGKQDDLLAVFSEKIAKLFGFAVSEIHMNSKMIDYSMGSIQYIQLVLALEEEFNIEFDEQYLVNDAFDTVGDLLDYVKIKMA